jgi:hypothetical protein
MAKKSAISGEYLIQVEDSGSVVVWRIFDNVKASLREIASIKEFEYNPDWTTRQFGSHICKEFGDGKTATVGGYVIQVRENGSIESYRHFENTKAALREIAEKIGFEYSTDWTTRQFGSKLVDALEPLPPPTDKLVLPTLVSLTTVVPVFPVLPPLPVPAS